MLSHSLWDSKLLYNEYPDIPVRNLRANRNRCFGTSMADIAFWPIPDPNSGAASWCDLRRIDGKTTTNKTSEGTIRLMYLYYSKWKDAFQFFYLPTYFVRED